MTSQLDILLEHELETGKELAKKDRLIGHLKSILQHQSSLYDFVKYFKEIEPSPTNNLIFLDHEYRIVDLTSNTAKFLGYNDNLDKIIGKTYTDLMIDPSQRDIFTEGVKQRKAFRQILNIKGNGRAYYVRSRVLSYLETKRDYLMGIVLRIKKANPSKKSSGSS